MIPSITLDYLISQSVGDALYFDSPFPFFWYYWTKMSCPLSLVKEAILRGFQIRNEDPIYFVDPIDDKKGNGRPWESSFEAIGDSSGYGFFYNLGSGSGGGCSSIEGQTSIQEYSRSLTIYYISE